MKQILTTLCYMHSKGIMHGDIKPNNILIERFPSKIKENKSMLSGLSGKSFDSLIKSSYSTNQDVWIRYLNFTFFLVFILI